MADWEQPSTSILRKAGAGGGDDEQIRMLRQEILAALHRIVHLEQRVTELETLAQGQKGQARGA